jgi:hypothetical protein
MQIARRTLEMSHPEINPGGILLQVHDLCAREPPDSTATLALNSIFHAIPELTSRQLKRLF